MGRRIPDESVDLIYLEPPFNSQATYNVLFCAPAREQSQAQIGAFEDTWHWNAKAEEAFDEVMSSGNKDVAEMLRAMAMTIQLELIPLQHWGSGTARRARTGGSATMAAAGS